MRHADRLSEARWRADLRPAVLGVHVEHQSRGGSAGPPDAQGPGHADRRSICPSMTGPSSAIARPEFTSSSGTTKASRGCRSTRRTASTARPATSRTRPRTSTGSRPRAAAGPIIRTCKWLGGAALTAMLLAPVSATAAVRIATGDPALTYLKARAAAMDGDHGEAAALLAGLAESRPTQPDLARKALMEAINAGQMDLALQFAQRMPAAQLPSEAKLMLAARGLRNGRDDRALAWLTPRMRRDGLDFLAPLVKVWAAADGGDLPGALSDAGSASRQQPPPRLSRMNRRRSSCSSSAERQRRHPLPSAPQRLPVLARLGFAWRLPTAFSLMATRQMPLPFSREWGRGPRPRSEQIRGGQRNGSVIDNGAKAFSESRRVRNGSRTAAACCAAARACSGRPLFRSAQWQCDDPPRAGSGGSR